MSAPEFWNKSDLAEGLQVSLPTAGRFIKEGLPVLSSGANGSAYKIFPSLAIHWYVGRSIAKDHGLSAKGTLSVLSLGLAVAIKAMEDGLADTDSKAFIQRAHGKLKKCINVNRTNLLLEVGRWSGILEKR